jgi:glyoxylase-like metal-dependent hydrolase (beta-lactamase superfamily II)
MGASSAGRATSIHALHCGGDVQDWAVFDPLDERAGTGIYNPYFVFVVRHPSGTVLFDSGAHPELRTNARERLGPAADLFDARLDPDHNVPDLLARIGLTPGDIDVVVQSHLHFDHAGGLEHLTHAPVYVQQDELDFAYAPPDDQRDIYVQADFDVGCDWRPLRGDHDLFGDGSVRIVFTPGHTAGHQSLLVRLPSQTVFLLSDAAYLVDKMRARRLPGVLWTPEAMLATWERVEAIEREEDALLLATHEVDYETRFRIAPDAWYE